MEISYKIVYSNRKTIGISVERDRSVIVRAPFKTSEAQIHEIVEKKKFLLFKKISHPQKFQIPKPYKEFVSGESILLLGKVYSLNLVDRQAKDVVFDNGFYLNSCDRIKANTIMREWFIQEAEATLTQRIKLFADRLGVIYKKIRIIDLQYQWGSCTPKGTLNFNWRIIKAPMNVVEYIIVHELAHLIEPQHSPEFWNIISVQLPAFKKAKDWLLKNGQLLEIDFFE